MPNRILVFSLGVALLLAQLAALAPVSAEAEQWPPIHRPRSTQNPQNPNPWPFGPAQPDRSPQPDVPQPGDRRSPEVAQATLKLDSYGVLPAGQVAVNGTYFTPFQPEALYWDQPGHQVGTATTDGSGNFSLTFAAPKDSLGGHNICAKSPTTCVKLDLLEAVPTASGAPLPATGTSGDGSLPLQTPSGAGPAWPLFLLLAALAAGCSYAFYRLRPWNSAALKTMDLRAKVTHRIASKPIRSSPQDQDRMAVPTSHAELRWPDASVRRR